MKIVIKRVYEEPDDADGVRVLVDRIWPRGVSKDKVRLDHWLKPLAPSTELRQWFAHDPAKWEAFKKRYYEELEQSEAAREAMDQLLDLAKRHRVTLLFGARDHEHNNARALKMYLDEATRR